MSDDQIHSGDELSVFLRVISALKRTKFNRLIARFRGLMWPFPRDLSAPFQPAPPV